jgi:hypothetical protein
LPLYNGRRALYEETPMKSYKKPTLRRLGLLRKITRFSF